MQSRDKLRIQAEEAAAEFQLPHDWREDRVIRQSLAIDGQDTSRPEDGLWFDFAHQALQVSSVDVGSYLYDGPVERYARHMLVSRTAMTATGPRSIPMTPPAISKRGLRLDRRNECPAITVEIPLPGSGDGISVVKSIVNARRLTLGSSGRLLLDGEGDIPNILRAADVVSEHLVGEFIDAAKNKPTGRQATMHSSIGSRLVKKCVLLASAAAANFMQQNNIPAIYYNHLWSDADKNFFSSESFGNSSIGVHNYARFTSPMRRFQDMVNQANLSAFLSVRPYPYPEHKLDVIVPDLNSHYGYEAVNSFSTRSTEYLKVVLENNAAEIINIADAFFASKGTTEAVNAVKQLAVQAVAQDPSTARDVIDLALSRNYLKEKELKLEGGIEAEPVLEDREGNIFADPRPDNWRSPYAGAVALGKICGIEISTPRHSQEQLDKILNEGSYMFIRKMAQGKDTRVWLNTLQEDDDTIVMDAYINGELCRKRFKGASRRESILSLASQYIVDHDLIYNPPRRLGKNLLRYSSIRALREWQVHTNAPPFEFEKNRGDDGIITCTMTVRTAEGAVHKVTGVGSGFKAGAVARRSAAAFLLLELPHGPYPWDGTVLLESMDENA